MKHLRKFDSIPAMETAIENRKVAFIGLAYDGDKANVRSVAAPPDPKTIPFYIDVRGSVTLAATSGLQMSTDGENWTDTTATTLSSGKTYFRVATDQSTPLKPNWTEDNNSDYDIGGNINSLVKLNFENDSVCYNFQYYFYNRTKLKSAGDLILPATTLANNCYKGMFFGCTSLTTAPALPATTLANSCYQAMFQNCTSLTTAPALPATTMATNCYSSMFQSCTSLTTAPALPATTLTRGCYSSMFYGCTSLTTAPELPATTLADACYCYMFLGCTSLTAAPELPATTLAMSCYQEMFQYCRSLTAAPALPATTLVGSCYFDMFYGCTSLTTPPELPATTLANECYYNMFKGCTSLTTAPELPATTMADSCYTEMFEGCTKLNYIKCLATNISATYHTYNWVSGVSSTGTFVKDPNMSGWTTGTSGIPSGWTVDDAQ